MTGRTGKRTFVVAALLVVFFLVPERARAGRLEKAIGAGISYYSGDQSKALSPPLSGQASFSANIIYRKFNIVNHFEFGLLSGGTNFGGSLGAYSGFVGSYELGVRLNLASESIQPYIEMGPAIGLFALSLGTTSSTTSNISQNQTALKYGYVLGTGFDWVRGGARGEGNGWGLGFSYFSFMKSPSMFEFPDAKLVAYGIKLEVRRTLGDDKK